MVLPSGEGTSAAYADGRAPPCFPRALRAATLAMILPSIQSKQKTTAMAMTARSTNIPGLRPV